VVMGQVLLVACAAGFGFLGRWWVPLFRSTP
jgi:hypothetical protein